MKSIRQGHSGGESPAVFLCQTAGRPHIVPFVHMPFWGKKGMGQASLIRQQQQALGVLVQTAYRKKLLPLKVPGQQFQNRLPPPVLGRGEKSGGLIQHNPSITAEEQRLSVHMNRRRLRVKLFFYGKSGGAVYRYQSPADQLFRLPAGPFSRGGDDFIQPLLFHGGTPPSGPFSWAL